jgi:hypothetical protein
MAGCAAKSQEVITCYPPYADIYWGKNASELRKSGFTTPHSRSISGVEREHWCYQVKKEGYRDSDIVCRKEEEYRNLDFSLVPLKTTITSKPSGATIYWGPSEDQLKKTSYRTPQTITIKDVSIGASWKAWYYQVKKEGYHDSEVVLLPQQSGDRDVKFELKSFAGGEAVISGKVALIQKDSSPNESTVSSSRVTSAGGDAVSGGKAALIQKDSSPNESTVSSSRVTLTWDYHSSNELGFKIERKERAGGVYHEIATTGKNVTKYTDSGLSPGLIYFYRVRAYNSHGRSAPSNEIRVKTSAH